MIKIIKKIIFILIGLSAIYGVGRLIDVSYGSFQFVERQPYMVMQTQNSIRVKWQTDEAEIGEVNYSTTEGKLSQNIQEKEATNKHSVTLTNLKECTKYYYSVDSKSLDIDNKGRSFSTLCQENEKQLLWIVGDSGDETEGKYKVYNQFLDYIKNDFDRVNMWILLGDNAYTSGTQEQFNTTLFEPFIEMVKRFTPWAVPGNHDMRRWAFYQIFDFPTEAESGGFASGHEEFYSIENGNLHLVMLDSETISRDSDGKMATWLKKDLAQNTKPWLIVAFHTPPYSDGGHKSDNDRDSGGRLKDMRENFVPIFDEYGVDLVLSGHSHGYERSKLILNHLGKSDTFSEKNILQDRKTDYIKPLKHLKNSGTIYQICGSSAKLDGADYAHPALPYSLHEMGSLLIELTPTTLTSKFLNINGKITDEFKITREKI